MQLDSGTQIVFADEAAKGEAEMLASLLRPATGLPLPVQPMPTWTATRQCHRALRSTPAWKPSLGKEGYQLDVLPTPIIRITAATPAGLFYGGQTLRQLLPAAVYAKTEQAGVKWQVPCCRIEDQAAVPLARPAPGRRPALLRQAVRQTLHRPAGRP